MTTYKSYRMRSFWVMLLSFGMFIGPLVLDTSAQRTRGSASRSTTSRTTTTQRGGTASRTTASRTTATRSTTVNRSATVSGTGYRRGGVVAGEEGYAAVGRRGAVVANEEGAAAIGRRGAVVANEEGYAARGRYGNTVVASEEGYAARGRYGNVVVAERYESYEAWRVVAGTARVIAIGTMLAYPPKAATTVVVSGTTYWVHQNTYYARAYSNGAVVYQVVGRPPGY